MTKNATKKALLLSVLSMLLCMTMLVGTTYAWFTDSVTVGGNTIESGTLRVDLVDDKGKSLEGETLSFKKAEGSSNELWEPGSRWTLQDIYVKNNGNLDLLYRIVLTGIEGDAKLNEVITWSIMVGDQTVTLTGGVSQEFFLAGGALSELLSISGVMSTAAGNEYQGLSIENISVKIEARQAPSEYDSFDNQYDKDSEYGPDYVAPEQGGTVTGTPVANATELADALSGESGTVVLTQEIALEEIVTVAGNYVLDLGGKALDVNVQNGLTVAEGASLTIKNGAINSSFEEDTVFSAAIYVSANAEVIVEDGAIINTNNPAEPNTWTDAKGIILRDNAVCTMNGGVINCYGTNGATGINSTYGSNSTINFNGGIINVCNGGEGYGIGIYAQSGTTLNLNGGIINVQCTGGQSDECGEAIDIGGTTTVNFNNPIEVNVFESTWSGNCVSEDDLIKNAVTEGKIIVNEK